MYKLTEHKLIGYQSDIHTYVTIDIVLCEGYDEDSMFLMIDNLFERGLEEKSTIRWLLQIRDTYTTKLVGRIALRCADFINHDGNTVVTSQIAGVKIERQYQQRGITTHSYFAMSKWYGYLVSDFDQTVPGAKIWANSLLLHADVSVYDCEAQKFRGRLGTYGVSSQGFIVWNSARVTNLNGWQPNRLQEIVNKFTILVLSKDRAPDIGLAIE